MSAERAGKYSRPHWEELSPGLSDALDRLLNDSVPEEFAPLYAARSRLCKSPGAYGDSPPPGLKSRNMSCDRADPSRLDRLGSR